VRRTVFDVVNDKEKAFSVSRVYHLFNPPRIVKLQILIHTRHAIRKISHPTSRQQEAQHASRGLCYAKELYW